MGRLRWLGWVGGGSGVVVLVLVLAVLLTGQCANTTPRARRELTPAEKAVIAGYTRGVISRESPIRVLFTEPMVEQGQLDRPVGETLFRFQPGIEGVAVWTTRSQLEFRPAARLADGQAYSATVELARLLKDTSDLERFDFSFAAMRQTFDVTIDGLEAADPANMETQQLRGRVVTADVDDAAKVEQLLNASQGAGSLGIDWAHAEDRRVHTFSVRGIQRAQSATRLRLAWDGRSLGVDKKDSREIEVPSLSAFSVSQVRAVSGDEQYVELRFTDPLRDSQRLAGLIQIAGHPDLRFAVSGNVVQIFSRAGFKGQQTVSVARGIRNALGYRLAEASEHTVAFEILKPQVRFVGKGIILPTSQGLTVPIEVVNLRAVTVEAMRVPDGTVPQFLQVNTLDGDRELSRVGRVVWKKRVPLDLTPDKDNRWVSLGLDLSPLVAAHPDGLYRLTLSFRRPDIIWSCPAPQADIPEPLSDNVSIVDEEQESSYWDWWEQSVGEGYWDTYGRRDDPCHPSYYRHHYDHDIRIGRNVLISDLGVLAKRGEDGRLLVVATNLQTAEPVPGARVVATDYQQETLAAGRTDRNGMAWLATQRKPFLVVVRSGGQTGYLRLDDGGALSMAHFDVAGATVPKGLKGFLYGERGVWRPGDTLHLAFILFDPAGRVPDKHPARLELIDSRGRVVRSLTRTGAGDGFYSFDVATSPEAPTGSYVGRVSVGGASFERTLKIETIMPNRLKIAMDFGTKTIEPGGVLESTLTSTWLHGGIARGLNADVEVAVSPAHTTFERYADYVFDDPTRRYETERRMIFEGTLDQRGQAKVATRLAAGGVAPGMLRAHITTRVFEPGGAFSVDRFGIPYSPYERYVGIRVPRGDKARGMLLTDVDHELGIVVVDQSGKPVPDGEVELSLYKIGWRWWWERGEEDLTTFAESRVHTALQSGTVQLEQGVATWKLNVKYPEWGRYLITATDRKGRHRTGKIVYIDWPGWAGRGQNEMAGGAHVLVFAPDTNDVKVGETVTLNIPTPQKGRGLVSLETGSRILRTEWLEVQGAQTRYTFEATAEMAPNVYAHVTLLQPHGQTKNDLPIRLYGVAPIRVTAPETRLSPVADCPEVFIPESKAKVTVRESSGRPMTYTLAIVDEGLLALTRFATPNPWDHFYAREALAVKTWDLFDLVAGARGAALERLLAIGGDEEGGAQGRKRANRFPPMVRFVGPVTLAKGASKAHEIDIPQYVGAVRVMVVAGRDGAFGAFDKSVYVRKPLMVLATLPRALGPDEEVALPVSVFALEDKVKAVRVSLETSGPLEIVGPSAKALSFEALGDELVTFRVRTRPALGVGKAVIRASSAGETAAQEIEVDVRASAVRVVTAQGAALQPGETWQPKVVLPGLVGTNEVTLEASRIPPLDLGRRLEYLIRYPHGCLEQTVSSVFPQVYLDKLLDLPAGQAERIQVNVKAGLERLKQFQTSSGGFGYWPGASDENDWVSSYAGHFMVEAKNAGYLIPHGLLDQWKAYQQRRAQAWSSTYERAELMQAYRLYTLALAGAPTLSAMNRLREGGELSVAARWRLAAAYHLAGQPEAARTLMSSRTIRITPYRELAETFGSDLRDKAMALEALAIMGDANHVAPLVKEVSEILSRNNWLSTQETAYALLALARCAIDTKEKPDLAFSYAWNGGDATIVTSKLPLAQRRLDPGSTQKGSLVVHNTGATVLFLRLVQAGLPPVGQEDSASSGMEMIVDYVGTDGQPLDPARLEQGTDLKVRVAVKNTGARGRYEQVALTHVVPSGWEILNRRMDPAARHSLPGIDYQDVRDDRVLTYFALNPGETKTIEIQLNASYLGRFYLPMIAVEAMYDATLHAREKGRWIEVVPPGTE